MSRRSPPPTRRRVLAASAAAGVASLFSKHLAIAGVTGSIEASQQGDSNVAIRRSYLSTRCERRSNRSASRRNLVVRTHQLILPLGIDCCAHFSLRSQENSHAQLLLTNDAPMDDEWPFRGVELQRPPDGLDKGKKNSGRPRAGGRTLPNGRAKSVAPRCAPSATSHGCSACSTTMRTLCRRRTCWPSSATTTKTSPSACVRRTTYVTSMATWRARACSRI